MNNENFLPGTGKCLLWHMHYINGNAEEKILTYEYNGKDIIKMHIPESDDTGFRHGSDGILCRALLMCIDLCDG